MVESSDKPSILDRPRSSQGTAHASPHSIRAGNPRPAIPLEDISTPHAAGIPTKASANNGYTFYNGPTPTSTGNDVADDTIPSLPPPAPPPPENRQGKESSSIDSEEKEKKPNIAIRFYECSKDILFASWLNVLLVFVPVGIAVQAAGVNKTIVFAINAIAIIPLAGLLSYATESVASDLGDTIGSLMNVTFGNAVELIIFIALTKNEIRIVQASLLGSILANLLLILGMCFLFGGLRFREQIYNSTVTQMSACLLSLSVMSLLLPTAFHASFTNSNTADLAVLQVSRGTSVILLLVYVLYLLFQLKSHAYMYQSTPQHVIDEESHPGLLHDFLDSSSSSDNSSSTSDTDSDGSSGSHRTAKRIKRVLTRGRRRRKSSAGSNDTPSVPSTVRTPSVSTFGRALKEQERVQHVQSLSAPVTSGYEADDNREVEAPSSSAKDNTINFRDFENEKGASGSKSPEMTMKTKSKRKHHKGVKSSERIAETPISPTRDAMKKDAPVAPRLSAPRVGFSQDVQATHENSPKRPFQIRGISVRDALPALPAMPKVLTSTVFSTAPPSGMTSGTVATTGITPRALHRSNSLPSRLNQTARQSQAAPALQPQPYMAPVTHTNTLDSDDSKAQKKHMSRAAAIILLLVSTGLVAVCAEFLVASIDYLVDNTSVSEAFVGLIILPIVGNAAEHVTAVTVASKNKMDLAIGVAVGSSIQIALFVTPVIVLLGWILAKDMSLYFSLFETISLFVSAFIVNFLVLDGRSNYLEGALLIAAYVIIALAAFFYPDEDQQSTIGGANGAHKMMMAML